jgi:hypothetical protein
VVAFKMVETRGFSLETIEEQYKEMKSRGSSPNASHYWKKETQTRVMEVPAAEA